MNMITNKVILIALALTIFIENTNMDEQWKQKCYHQLKIAGKFKMEQNKTEAFMYAYYNSMIPTNNLSLISTTGILYNYLEELWEKFLTAHKYNLQYMFQDPLTWCQDHIQPFLHMFNVGSNIKRGCNKSMKIKAFPAFTESQESALKYIFLKMKIGKYKRIKVMVQEYLEFIAPTIESYVEYTDVRSPTDFCECKESPAEYYISLDENGNVVKYANQQFNSQQPSTSTQHVYQDNCTHNLNEPNAFSSVRGLNIDLNE